MANERLPLLPLILDGVPQGLRQALAQEGICTTERRPGAPQGRFLLFDSRAGRRDPPGAGQIGIDVRSLRRGFRRDPFDALLDERPARFVWKIGDLTLDEEIARVDKRAVRRRLLDRLRTRIEGQGGIWLRVAPFPFPYRSALSFRIDYDEYDPADFDATLKAIAGYEGATSHFVNGAAYEGERDALTRLAGLDVGSHGYHHHTYRTEEENLANVARGIDTLRGAGIEPSGFAAPHGRFNRELVRALGRLGVTHSSEFGLAYDELPFFVGGNGLLQIPAHPVCLGLFLEAGKSGCDGDPQASDSAAARADERAAEYFEQWVRSRYQAGEPVLLYGHPTRRLGRHPRVLRRVFQAASGCGALWQTTFTEINRWWRARAQVRLTVTHHDDKYVVVVNRAAPGYRAGAEYCRGEHVASMPLDGRVVQFASASLGYERREAATFLLPVRIDRGHGLRGHFRRLIDWERVTPADEIMAGDWRNWTKRTLRRLWGD